MEIFVICVKGFYESVEFIVPPINWFSFNSLSIRKFCGQANLGPITTFSKEAVFEQNTLIRSLNTYEGRRFK